MAADIGYMCTVEKVLNEFMNMPLYTGRSKSMLDGGITCDSNLRTSLKIFFYLLPIPSLFKERMRPAFRDVFQLSTAV